MSVSDRIVWSDSDFWLTPTVGPLTANHSLLIPRSHVSAFAHLPDELKHRAEQLVAAHSRVLLSPGEELLAFEHGMSSHMGGGGCGVTHAHLHLVPVNGLNIAEIPEPTGAGSWTDLPSDGWVHALPRTRGYVVLVTAGRPRTRSVRTLPSQYMRRWLGGLLGTDRWDWREAQLETMLGSARRLRARYAGAWPTRLGGTVGAA